jgi:hypothetical protein
VSGETQYQKTLYYTQPLLLTAMKLSDIRTRSEHCLQPVFIKTLFTLLLPIQEVRQAYVMQGSTSIETGLPTL